MLQGPDGHRFTCTVVNVARRELVVSVGEQLTPPPLPSRHVVLLQAAVKEKAADLIVQKVTELGIAALWFFPAERSTVAHKVLASAHQRERWERMAWEACKQCDRQGPPELRILPDWHSALAEAAPFTRWMLEASAPDNSAGLLHADALLANAKTENARPARPEPGGTLTLLVGPEGGLTNTERQEALSQGWQALALGRTVLRAETAALAACSLALFGLP